MKPKKRVVTAADVRFGKGAARPAKGMAKPKRTPTVRTITSAIVPVDRTRRPAEGRARVETGGSAVADLGAPMAVRHTLAEREDPTDLKAVTLAAQKAFDMARLKPSDINVAELHDAFTILEIAESEHVGFFKKGEGGKAALAGKTRLGGQIPINVSGGLKARGHPVGGTGVAQIVDIVWQLRHELPENRQVKNAQIGLTVNFGGFGNNVLCFILRRVQ